MTKGKTFFRNYQFVVYVFIIVFFGSFVFVATKWVSDIYVASIAIMAFMIQSILTFSYFKSEGFKILATCSILMAISLICSSLVFIAIHQVAWDLSGHAASANELDVMLNLGHIIWIKDKPWAFPTVFGFFTLFYSLFCYFYFRNKTNKLIHLVYLPSAILIAENLLIATLY